MSTTQGTARSILKNIGAVGFGKVSDKLLALLCGVIVARTLGAERLGIFSFAFAYLGFFQQFAGLGIRDIVTRNIARDRTLTDGLMGSSIMLVFVSSVLLATAANLVMPLFRVDDNVRLVVGIASLAMLFSFSSLYQGVFQVYLRMELATVAGVLAGILKVALFLWIALAWPTVLGFVLACVGVGGASFVFVYLFSRKLTTPRVRVDWEEWRRCLKDGLPLLVLAGLSMVYHRIDQIMLFSLTTSRTVGLYATGVRIAEALRLIPIAIMTPVFPLLSRSWVGDKAAFHAIYARSTLSVTVCTFPFLLVLLLFGRPVIGVLFGAEFMPAQPMAVLLALAEILLFGHLINTLALVAMNCQRLLLPVVALSALTNVVLNAVLIPRFGGHGACYATMISYCVLPVCTGIFPQTRRLFYLLVKTTAPVFIVGVVSLALGFWMMRSCAQPAWRLFAASLGVYSLGCLAVPSVRGEIGRLTRAVFPK